MHVGPWLPPYVAPKRASLESVRTLYVVGYAHLDTQWRWSFPMTISEFLPDTVDRNIEAFEKFPNYIFNFTGASRYQLIREYFPERYSAIREWVKKGRWFPNGNQWEECDVLVPSSESLLRQILHGRRYFQQEFGTESQDFMLPDSFGYPASLPSILAHAGLRGFSTQKLSWNPAVPVPFNVGTWKGADGRGVIAALRAGNYGAKLREPLSRSETWQARLDENGKSGGLKVDYLYNGTGDVGGAPHEVSLVNVDAAARDTGPVKVVAGAADQMFRDIGDAEAKQLPSYSGDLLLTEHSAGSITSQAFIKWQNRANELLADAAERAAVAADLLGALPYPAMSLEQAWQLTLRGQFHDIITGTSVPKAYEYSWNDEFVAMNEFTHVLTDAVAGIARGLDTRTAGTPLVVYNPLSIPRQDLVEIAVPTDLQDAKAVIAHTPEGKAIPTQLVTGSDGRKKLLFSAAVPAVSFSVFSLQAGESPAFDSRLRASERSLESDRYRVQLNAAGDIQSVFDVQAQRELLSAPMRLTFLTEWPSDFPAWNMDWADRRQEPRSYVTGTPKIRLLETGPLRVAMQVERESEGSRFLQTVRLAFGPTGDRVEFIDRIDWKTGGSSLKMTFPFSVKNPEATYNWDLGTVLRGNNQPKLYEVPTHAWLDLTDTRGDYGVTLLTGAKYGSDKPTDDTVRLTLLYTPTTTSPYREQNSQDWGRHDISYALAGHARAFQRTEAHWQAQRFEQPLLAFAVPKHGGPLGKRFSLLASSSEQVAIQALKRSEDGKSVIVRLQELTGRGARTQLSTAGSIKAAWETTGVEQPICPLTLEDGKLPLDFLPNQLRTVSLSLAPTGTLAAPSSLPLALPYDLDAISYNRRKSDGDCDGIGSTLPAELWSSQLQVAGVTYQLGSAADGKKNALVANGQILPLPNGYSRLHLLAASMGGNSNDVIQLDRVTLPFNVAQGSGFLGQWDNRVFAGEVEEATFSVQNPLLRLAPAYLRTDRVALAVSHWHRSSGEDDPYAYAYLFAYSYPIAAGTKTLVLPKNPQIRIFAVTVSKDDNDGAVPLVSQWPELTRDASFHARFDKMD